MKKLLLKQALMLPVVVCSLIAGAPGALAIDNLVVTTPGGTQSISIDKIQSIKFGENNYTIHSTDGNVTVAIPGSMITFDLNATDGIDRVTLDDGITLRAANGTVLIERGSYEGQLALAVYTPAGALVMADKAFVGNTVDLSRLAPGTYIVTVNNSVIRLINR